MNETLKLVLSLLLCLSTWTSWRDFRKQLIDAEGEENIRPVFVRFVLSMIIIILAIIVFWF
ncbi:hypothetical protein [Gracilibacillus xinjiangensis]|uniref:Uncharacterized protein n=1 Tax=Gracilibacillus xinjiangensis TaxID=1193282 RepID=A0ABV8WYZ4_9BACI